MSGRLTAASPEDVTAELDRLLGQVAARIAEHGTAAERDALHVVAFATRWVAPGAAAALVDWWGSETARLRAYGVLHGVVLRALGREEHSWLVDRLRGGTLRSCATLLPEHEPEQPCRATAR